MCSFQPAEVAMDDFNYFNGLRPSRLEFCDCHSIERLLLFYTLTDNPIHCFACKWAVDPETLSLSDEQVCRIVAWHRQFRALYDLWLDSGEYEAWAKTQLLQPGGQVNVAVPACASMLSELIPTYYWWFHRDGDPVPGNCPACRRVLGPATLHGHAQSDVCKVVIQASHCCPSTAEDSRTWTSELPITSTLLRWASSSSYPGAR